MPVLRRRRRLQVRLGLERHREELQRQVAALDSQVGPQGRVGASRAGPSCERPSALPEPPPPPSPAAPLLPRGQVAIGRARLEDATAEAASLSQRLALERTR
jgi:centrosomal protein CEP135